VPCVVDEYVPSARENALATARFLLRYVLPALGKPVPDWAQVVGYSDIKRCDEAVSLLCETLRAMKPAQFKRIVHDGSNPLARRLADWWDQHQEADRRRSETPGQGKKRRGRGAR